MNAPATQRVKIDELFFMDRSLVDVATGCHVWTRATNSHGYGAVRTRGRDVGAHCLSYELFVGPVPAGMHVCHSCDVNYAPGDPSYRRCVNPKHLFLGTTQENTADKVAKGRQNRGSTVGTSKLTEADVEEIVAALYAGEPGADIARRKSVSVSTVSLIRLGKTWAHVPRPWKAG